MRVVNGPVSGIRRTRRFYSSSGFSLIELMVVVLVLGILTAIAVPIYYSAQANSRDKMRIADMRNLESALESYKFHHNQYPPPDSEVSGWETSDYGDFLSILTTEGYLDKDPVDPGNSRYVYYRYPAGYRGAVTPFYVLAVSNMEKSGQPHPDSPGWVSADLTRDWGTEGGGNEESIDYREWVTGAHE